MGAIFVNRRTHLVTSLYNKTRLVPLETNKVPSAVFYSDENVVDFYGSNGV